VRRVAISVTAYGYPGTSPAISSNDNVHQIVRALDVSGYGNHDPAVLHAYRYNLAGLYNKRRRARATPQGLPSSLPCRRSPMAKSTSARRPNSTSTGCCRDSLTGRCLARWRTNDSVTKRFTKSWPRRRLPISVTSYACAASSLIGAVARAFFSLWR
jgi:hypothetical protein